MKSAPLIALLKKFRGTKSSQGGRHEWLCELIYNYFVDYSINLCEVKKEFCIIHFVFIKPKFHLKVSKIRF